MFHILFITLLFSCTVIAWGGGWGNDPGSSSGRGGGRGGWPGWSHGRPGGGSGSPSSGWPGFSGPNPQDSPDSGSSHSSSKPATSSVPTKSPVVEANSSASTNPKTTDITQLHSTSIHSQTTPPPHQSSSVVTNAHAVVNTSQIESSTSTGSYTTSTLSSTGQTEPTNPAPLTPAGDLTASNSQMPIIVGVCVAGALLLIVAGYLLYRRRSKRSQLGFSSDRMVQQSGNGVSVSQSPPASPAFFSHASNTPLIASAALERPSMNIPNPFESDLDYCYSTTSQISIDDGLSDVSDHVITMPGPSVHSCRPVHTPVPLPAYTRQ